MSVVSEGQTSKMADRDSYMRYDLLEGSRVMGARGPYDELSNNNHHHLHHHHVGEGGGKEWWEGREEAWRLWFWRRVGEEGAI